MAEARDRLGAAKALLSAGFPSAAVSPAYYAMLNAARAALSEEDRYAKTHSGTWMLFRETFFSNQRFDHGLLVRAAEDTLKLRLGNGLRSPRRVSTEEAESVVELAERFVVAVEALYAD
jgi:uncharacterized protein (UPF0332 family)